ncbi:MAG: rhodanese-like domain-containing protein [Pseudomonadota bacterium]
MKTMSSSDFREYRRKTRETEYVLIDVRQPGEYTRVHIPGAQLIPLGELEEKIDELPDKDLIFYCRSGARSRVAALNAEYFNTPGRTIINLEGGMLAWDGERLKGFPDMAALNMDLGREQILMSAMDLEKGAHRFYSHVMEQYPGLDLNSILAGVRDGEMAHARLIYSHLKAMNPGVQSFEDIYSRLKGDILEGGQPLDACIAEMGQDTRKIDILEIGILMEYQAYDMYRNIADTGDDKQVTEAFFSLSQAEKHHMDILIKAIDAQ